MGANAAMNWDTSDLWRGSEPGETSGAVLRMLLQSASNEVPLAAPLTGIDDPRVHGYVASVFLGVLLPLSIVVARNFKEFNPKWFHVHRVLGVLAFVGGLIGVIFGQYITKNEQLVLRNSIVVVGAEPVPSYHKGLGWLAVVLVAAQMTSLVLRPAMGHKYRGIWEICHHWSGRVAVAFSIANVYNGAYIAKETAKYYWGYSIVLGVIVLAAFSKEIVDIARYGLRDHNSVQVKVPALKMVEQPDEEAAVSSAEKRSSSEKQSAAVAAPAQA